MTEINQPMMVIRKRLSATEGDPPNTRYNPDTDIFETSVDGGTTWTPNPGADPRSNPAYLMPPVEGSNAQCAAAFGMTEGIREYVDGIQSASSAGTIATFGLSFMALAIPAIGTMWALALLVADAINVIGVAIVVSAFTEEVYEQLLCIFFNNIDPDGRISAAQMADVQTAIDSDIGDSSVSAVTALFFSQWGFVGLTNNGFRLQDGSADCEDCGCPGGTDWCQTLFEREIESPAGFTVVTDEWGAQGVRFDEGAEGWAWESVPNLNRGTSERATLLLMRRTIHAGNYSHVELACTLDFGTFSTDIRQFTVKIGATTILSQSTDFSDVLIWDGDIDLVADAVLEIQGVFSYVNPGTSDGGASLYRMTIGGAGTVP